MVTPSSIEIGHGHALGGDPRSAGAEAARAALARLDQAPSLVLVFASAHGDPAEAQAGVREVAGEAPLLGVSTDGEIDGADLAGAVAVAALATTEVAVRVGVAERCGRAVELALEEALAAAGVTAYLAGPGPWLEAARAGRSLFAFLLVAGEEAGAVERLGHALARRSGRRLPVLPIAAAGAPGTILAGGRAIADGVAVALVETTLEVGVAAAADAQALRDAVLRGRVGDPVLALAGVRGPAPRGRGRDEVAVMTAALGGVPLVGFRTAAGRQRGVTALVLGRDPSREAQVARQNALLLERARRGEAQVRALLDSVPDLAWMKDAEGRFVAVNQPFAAFLGQPREAVIGRRDVEVLPPALAAGVRARDGDVLAGAPASRDELLAEDACGRPVWLELLKAPVRDDEGRVAGVAGVARDVTWRKELEALRRAADDELEQLVRQRTRELAESEERYRALVRGTPHSAVFLIDAELRCTLAEGTLLARIAGGAQVVGRRLSEHPPGAAGALAELAELEAVTRRALAGETVEVEAQVGPLALLVRAAPFGRGEGGIRAAMLVATDVSERRRLEQQVQQAQKMEAVGRLAGGIAHDFNNILTVILGSARDLRWRAAEGEARELAQEVLDAGERAAALTRQLLAFSRQQALRPRDLDVNEVVRDLEKMVRRLIGEDIAVTSALAPGRAAVRADPSQLEQVILNLVVNARDAMPGGGRLTLETRLVDGAPGDAQRPPSAAPHVLLRVSDTGAGMAPEVLAHLFEPFFTTKERGQGTGLGLATVYGVVQQSGGAVAVRSAPGEGTTFDVYLPRLVEEGAAAEDAGGEPARPRGQETVLLVEDDHAVRALMRRVLDQAGYRVVEARQPSDAPRLAEEAAPDLLLTDVVMPGLAGGELAGALLARRPGLRVLFVSGYTEDAALRSGALPAGQAFLQKPFSGDELARAVRETLDAPLAAPGGVG